MCGKNVNLVPVPGLYLHIPFCKRACGYCDFFKSTSLAKRTAVLEAMRREMRLRAEWGPPYRFDTVYFGGGTPSVLSVGELGELLADAARLWDCSQVTETTVEANPDDLSPAYLSGLREAGFDRLSVGVQSFSDPELRLMNRRHNAAAAVRAVRDARGAGFGNISLDLIYGLPGSDAGSWSRTLETAVGLRPEHISAYHLTVEPGTAFGLKEARGELETVPEEESVRQYALLHETLTAAGYEHYEISSFALPGFRSRHNSSYWTGEPYVGIGPAAHSYDGAVRRWAPASLERYIAEAGTEKLYGSETLTPSDRRNEYVMLRLRTAEGICKSDFGRRFGAQELLSFAARAEKAVRSGLLAAESGRWRITPEKFFVSDAVISSLFE